MEYQLELKPHKPINGQKYKIIQLTDIAYHTSVKKPTSIGKKLRQAFKFMKPGRIYGNVSKVEPSLHSPKNNQTIVDMLKRDPEFVKMIQEEKRKGYKVLLSIPHAMPLIPGQDTLEFINSVNGKRILRGLAKN